MLHLMISFLHQYYLKLIMLIVCFSLVSCVFNEHHRHLSLINKTKGKAVIEQGGLIYDVSFIPLFSGPKNSSKVEVAVGLIHEVYDSGTPALSIQRRDQVPLRATDFNSVKAIAAIACAQNPKWNINKNPKEQQKYGLWNIDGILSYKGDGFIENGTWHLYSACD